MNNTNPLYILNEISTQYIAKKARKQVRDLVKKGASKSDAKQKVFKRLEGIASDKYWKAKDIEDSIGERIRKFGEDHITDKLNKSRYFALKNSENAAWAKHSL